MWKKYYDLSTNIIDFDSFTEFKKDKCLNVEVKAYIRVIMLDNNKISKKHVNKTFIMQKIDNSIKIDDGLIKVDCPTCGTSVYLKDGYCKFCHKKLGVLKNGL